MFLVCGVACSESAPPEPNNDINTPDPVEVADEDYTVTSTGLKIYDIKEGDGEEVVAPGDVISVHYFAWLSNGNLVDSSYLREEPFVFQLGTGYVIAGWDEGIVGMRIGGERQLVVPPELAYGEQGSQIVPPNSTMIFEIELVAISQ